MTDEDEKDKRDHEHQKRVSETKPTIHDICNPESQDEYVITNINDALETLKLLKKDYKIKSKAFTRKSSFENFPFGLWFRGEPKSETPLTPSIFRKKDDSIYRERGMIWDVGRRIPECNQLTSQFERLCLAQHYLVPTRLLDWTENILTALYFAVSGNSNEVKKLYILNCFTLNKETGFKEGKASIYESTDYGALFRSLMAFSSSAEQWNIMIKKNHPEWDWKVHKKEVGEDPIERAGFFSGPIAVVSAWTNSRMKAQSSVFTLHGGSLSWEKPIKPEIIPQHSKDEKAVYFQLTIPKNAVSSIKDELLLLGVHQGTVFPEIDKQREYFESVWLKYSEGETK